MRGIVALLLVMLVLLGGLGLPVYSHSCSSAGTTYRTIGVHTEACKVHEKKEVEPACCHRPKVVEKHSCCSESVTRLALSFHYLDVPNASPYIVPSVNPSVIFETVETFTGVPLSTGIPSNRPPPWISVNRYLSAICVWRI